MHLQAEPPSEEQQRWATFHDILASPRRAVIARVLEAQDAVEIGDLAEIIGALENDTSIEDLGSSQRKRVYISLYQTHLPRMDDAGVVDYDQRSGSVARGPEFPELLRVAHWRDDEDGGDTDQIGWLEPQVVVTVLFCVSILVLLAVAVVIYA